MNYITNDPDLHSQCFNDHGIFTLDELNELSIVVKPHLSALHLNTRSFNQHFDEWKNLLDSVPFVFDFIGCSETFLTNHSDLDTFEIPGYNMIIDNRTFSSGGGVALYAKEDLVFQRRHHLRIDNTENSWIETNGFIDGVIYKPPFLSDRDFLDKLEEILHKIYLSKRKYLIMGDKHQYTR